MACPKAQESGTTKRGVLQCQVGKSLFGQHVDVLRHASQPDCCHICAGGGDCAMRLASGVVGHWVIVQWGQRMRGGINPGSGGSQFYPMDQEPGLCQAQQRPGTHHRVG